MADSPVERLIDQGLERYGKGDLDGALIAWENALALAPDDARAAGYVEYVRGHYDLLRGAGGAETASELAVPFGLSEMPDSDAYEIEISSEAQRVRVEAFIDRVDDGWFLDDDHALPTVARPLPLPARPDSIDAPMSYEMEADEPGAPGTGAGYDELDALTPGFEPWGGRAESPRPSTLTGDDDQTHDFGPARLSRLPELDGGGAHPFDVDDGLSSAPSMPNRSVAARASAPTTPPVGVPVDDDFEARALTRERSTGGGGGEPGDFDFDNGGDETAELEKRHLGFVKLSAEPADPVQPGSGFAGPEMSTAEIRVRFKKDEVPPPAGRPSLEPAAPTPDPAADLDLPEPKDAGTLDLGPAGTLDLDPPADVPRASSAADEDERTQEHGRWARARSPRAGSSGGSAIDHLDLDDGGSPSIAPPVIIDDPVMTEPSAFDPAHRNAPTREFPPVPAQTRTRDFPPAPTATKTIPRAARVAAPTAPPAPALEPAPPPPTAPLLAELDAAAPPGESLDERTRRRITTLLERATAAGKDGRHAEAVSTCELALAEAPDSAVAQKLVHRTRDAIVAVYLGFLGNLEARPALAVPMHELPREQIDSRAAFLLSRIDGNLSLEEILDVSGMTRLEALRHLARMVGRGILSIR